MSRDEMLAGDASTNPRDLRAWQTAHLDVVMALLAPDPRAGEPITGSG